jgi:hypothetical protein
MKKTLLAALAIAGFAVTTGAQAQTTTNIGSGSALLYFNKIEAKPDTGTTALSNSLIVNLGDLSRGFSDYNLNLNTALTAAYGAGWSTNETIKWGVIGGFNGQEAAPNAYGITYSRPSSTTSFDFGTIYNVGIRLDYIYTEANALIYQTGSVVSTLGVTHGTVLIENGTINEDGVVSNGYGVYAADQDGFGVWPGSLATHNYLGLTQNIYFNGAMDNDGNYADQPVREIGRVSLASNGTLSVAVPEPSTYALFGFAALILIVAYRRANA